MSRGNVFVIAADQFNLRKLKTLPVSEAYDFHPLLPFEQTQQPERYSMEWLVEQAEQTLDKFEGSIDGIVGWWDMPVSALAAHLTDVHKLPGPTLESVIACEHKYWSRIRQRDALSSCVPQFRLVNPFEAEGVPRLGLDYPFWIKPVKSFQSHLAFKVESDEDMQHALKEIRAGIHRMADPFNHILKLADLPEEIDGIDGYYCIAEQLVQGHQCTAEGYVWNGEVTVYGIIDSIRYEGVSSFARYEYPSMIPEAVQEQIRQMTAQLIRGIGFEHGPFNVEFFWDQEKGCTWALEVNPRISQSHARIFEHVDGVSHHEVAADLAVGREPQWKPGAGRFAHAAKCYLRVFEDGVLTRMPSEADIRRIEQEIPGAEIQTAVESGQRLAELPDQDSYSYVLAEIHLGADSRDQLLDRYHQCVESLPFEISGKPVQTLQPAG